MTEQPVSTNESKFLGVSIRGWITLVIVTTVCIIMAAGAEVKEPLYGAFTVALGFYYGQKTK